MTLTPYEYAALTKLYGCEAVSIDELGNPVLRKIGGRCLFQDSEGLCVLQPTGFKPVACKMWPFFIRRRPLLGSEDALFQYESEDYYVYIDRSYVCPGVGKGDSERLHLTLAELISIWHNPARSQLYSTSFKRETSFWMKTYLRYVV